MAAPYACFSFMRLSHTGALMLTAVGKRQQLYFLSRLMKQQGMTFSTSQFLFNSDSDPRKTDSRERSKSNSTDSSNSKPSSNNIPVPKVTENNTQDRLGHLMQMYEDIVGLTEVKQAQDKVVNAEQKFLNVQEDRRTMQQELLTVQAEVRAVGAELEKTSRTDSRYIDLVKKEHEILLIEKEMSNKIKALDKAERDFFSLLSTALRESHEKERARAEKTKYWSIIGSIIGAIIGIIGSTVNNMKRMKELRAIVTESGENTAEYKALANRVLETVVAQHSQIEEFVHSLGQNENLQENKLMDPLFVNHKDFTEHTDTILQVIENQSKVLQTHLQDIQQLVGIHKASETESERPNVIYMGPELEDMLKRTEQRLESDLKRNNWLTAAALGGVTTLGISVIIYLLQSSS